ncbi:hypothetical protein V5O48_003054 [Marasmius crinis-equi]|uniref:FAD-binding domain-containing protein n=1 Tax=Marasmius crinis-equi TaxID=585013 RepID=A0ABR3FU24_9AGAR
MPPNNLRVLIAGGSVAGLTLANILERVGIDYLLLESHREWAPDVGASLGVFPNGLRILDQIGCYTPVLGLVEDALKDLRSRDSSGKVVVELTGASKEFGKRFGYKPVFVDRRMVVRVLYKNIRDKSKCLVNKRVNRLEQVEGGVTVYTKDGSSYTGSILIGADGVHSTIRREMWRIADSVSPGYFPKDRADVSTTYCCIFGISDPTEGYSDYSSDTVMGEGYSYLIASGPNNCVYWFLFSKLPETVRGLYDDLPRYTDEERDRVAQKHAKDPITERLTFGDLYKNRRTAVLTALPEYVMEKWHFGRVLTIGDASHKFNPIGGQGGNSAIESAAVLTNELIRLQKSKPSGAPFTDAEIDRMFASFQQKRHARSIRMKEVSHGTQSLQALETFQMKLIAKYLFPLASPEDILHNFSASCLPGARVDILEVPTRSHTEPWDDELPAKPISSNVNIPVAIAAGAFILLLAAAKMHMQPLFFEFVPQNPDNFLSQRLPATYTGIEGFDDFLRVLVYVFQYSVGWVDAGHTVHFIYLITLLFPLIVIWTAESYRRGTKGSLISQPGLIGTSYNFQGIGVIGPLYYLLSVWTTRPGNAMYNRVAGRRIPEFVASAILPGTILGYIVPSVLMFIPAVHRSPVIPYIVALWQFAPALAEALIILFGRLFAHLQRSRGKEVTQSPTTDIQTAFSRSDLPHLRRAYLVAFIFSFFIHVALLFALFTQPSSDPLAPNAISFTRLFTFAPTRLAPNPTREILLAESLFRFLKFDFWYSLTSVLCYSLYSVYALRARGFITTEKAVRAAVMLIISQVVVGPSASVAGMWYWREGILALDGYEQFAGVEPSAKANGSKEVRFTE